MCSLLSELFDNMLKSWWSLTPNTHHLNTMFSYITIPLSTPKIWHWKNSIMQSLFLNFLRNALYNFFLIHNLLKKRTLFLVVMSVYSLLIQKRPPTFLVFLNIDRSEELHQPTCQVFHILNQSDSLPMNRLSIGIFGKKLLRKWCIHPSRSYQETHDVSLSYYWWC